MRRNDLYAACFLKEREKGEKFKSVWVLIYRTVLARLLSIQYLSCRFDLLLQLYKLHGQRYGRSYRVYELHTSDHGLIFCTGIC